MFSKPLKNILFMVAQTLIRSGGFWSRSGSLLEERGSKIEMEINLNYNNYIGESFFKSFRNPRRINRPK